MAEKDATESMADVVESIVGMMGQGLNACDFADVQDGLSQAGRAFVGVGQVTAPAGQARARAAVEAALLELRKSIASAIDKPKL